jgi:hypothetical protein
MRPAAALLQVSKNATTMANRFKTLGGLKLLLSQELSAVSQHQASCLQELRQLQGAVGDPAGPEEMLIEQAGQCGRCRWDGWDIWEGIWRDGAVLGLGFA